MIIARYIAKEILVIFATLTFILLFIALSNKFVLFLAKAAAGKLPLGLVFKVVALYVPELFTVLAPVAMFVAILFTFSRLYAESEITVLLTCGVGWGYLLRVVLAVASVVALLVAFLSVGLVPNWSAQREKLLAQGQVTGVINSITPGRFQTIEGEERLVFYVEDVLDDGSLHNIFIAQQPRPGVDKETVIVTANRALVQQEKKRGEFFLVLRDGYRYTGTPGLADYTITKFAEYGRTLKYDALPITSSTGNRGTGEMLYSTQPEEIAEVQWRFGLPVAVVLLALLAVPLAKVQPRQGRFAKFLPAVLVYMVYYNVMTIVRRAIAKGALASMPGLWLVHLGLLVVGIFLVLQMVGKFQEWRYSTVRDGVAV